VTVIDFHDAEAVIFCVGDYPIGADENFWRSIVRHGVTPFEGRRSVARGEGEITGFL
jgi:hypothetical protein